MAKEKQEKRYDSQRHVLHEGEYERSPGKYVYRWREEVGRTAKGNKKYIHHAITANSLDELKEKKRQIRRDTEDGIKVRRPETLNDYVDRRLKAKGLRESTRNNYSYMYDRFVRKTKLGRTKVQEIKKSDISDFYDELVDKGDLSISTCEVLQNCICPALTIAEDDDVIRRNPAHNALKELKRKANNQAEEDRALGRKKPKTLSLAEQIRYLDVLEGDTYFEPPLVIALCCGMRVGELCGLRWSDIWWDTDRIHIRASMSYRPNKKGKSSHSIGAVKSEKGDRYVPITPLVRRMLEQQTALNLQCKNPVGGVGDFVFVNREGNPHGQGTINRKLHRLVTNANDSADIEHGQVLIHQFSSHTLRRTFCCNMVRKGYDLESIATMMGHNDIQTTHNHYAVCKELIATDKDQKLIDELKRRGIL